jgi:class 3 adenylate cyclase
LELDLTTLLKDLDGDVAQELSCLPEVIDKGDALVVAELPIEARRWHRVEPVVAVVADLKSSTLLGLNKHAASTASIYEAATGGVVTVLGEFEADYIAIQGDGATGLFWGDNCLARAVCAGITVKTFSSRHLVPRLEKKWSELPETGFKVGVATSPVLVKKVGLPRTTHQEPVWAGRTVNYAAKCAQQADRHEMIVTGAIWDWAADNDYLAVSCGCGNPPSPSIWKNVTIDKIPESDPDREGKCLVVGWCENCGPGFCCHVLDGDTKRAGVADQQMSASRQEQADPVRSRAARDRRDRLARRRGLSRF